jgi:hypothetical protein
MFVDTAPSDLTPDPSALGGSTLDDLACAGVSMATMLFEAQSVIGMRVLGMMGLWPMAAQEPMQMIHEKAHALNDANHAVARAIWQGECMGGVAKAGVAPLRDRTRANARRLSADTMTEVM